MEEQKEHENTFKLYKNTLKNKGNTLLFTNNIRERTEIAPNSKLEKIDIKYQKDVCHGEDGRGWLRRAQPHNPVAVDVEGQIVWNYTP